MDLGVRVGTGLVLTIAASKIPLLAAGTLCYPLWWPVYKAWSQNQKLRSSYRWALLTCYHMTRPQMQTCFALHKYLQVSQTPQVQLSQHIVSMHCFMRSRHTMRQGITWVIATACKYACTHCGAGMWVCGKPVSYLLIWQHLLEVYGSRSPVQSSTSCLEMLAAQEHKLMFHITKGWHLLCFTLDLSGPACAHLCGRPQSFVHNSPVMACTWSVDDATGSMLWQQILFLCRYEDVHVGESAELLLLSNTPDFSSFKVGLALALSVQLLACAVHAKTSSKIPAMLCTCPNFNLAQR